MERCVADISHARAGKKHERSLDAAGQPDRDAITGANSGRVEVLRHRIDPLQRAAEGQASVCITQRKSIGIGFGRRAQKTVQRVRSPIAARVELARAFDVQQGEHSVHSAACDFRPASGLSQPSEAGCTTSIAIFMREFGIC